MRNTVYICVILCFILQNVKSKQPVHTRSELKPDSTRPNHADEKFDLTKFVDVLLNDAKKIHQKHKKIGKLQKRTTEKTATKTVDEGLESSYDSLGLDENAKVQIVRSNNPGLDLETMGQIFRSNPGLDLEKMRKMFRSGKQEPDYKKIGQILRSNAGPDNMEMEGGAFRAGDRPSDEEGTELLFDLEDEDGLTNPL